MSIKIARPTDDYSPDWADYWEQNPHMLRSVGADVVDPPKEPPADPASPPQEPNWKEEAEKSSKELAELKRLAEERDNELKALRKSKQEILDERKKEAKAAEEARLEAAKKAGDVESIEKSWQEKYERDLAELKAQYEPKLQTFQKQLHDMTVGATARDIAAKVFVNTKVGLPHILPRLSLEETEDGSKVRVLDASGKPSALSVDDLIKELTADPDLAQIVVGSKASGAGGPSGKGGGGDAGLKRSKMSPADKAKYIDEHGQSAYLKLPK